MAKATGKYKLLMFCLYAIAYSIFYLLPNFRPINSPELLPLFWVDRWIPFVPWTFIIYTSDYLFVAFIILVISGLEEFNSYSRMMFGVLFISGIIFIFFPTTYPRPAYPVGNHWYIQWLMNLVGTYDTPHNCFPSMHVGLTAVSAWCVRHRALPQRIFIFLWAIAIFVSTLTTKQHYFVDILGGFGVTVTVVVLEWSISRRWLGYQKKVLNHEDGYKTS